MSYKQIVLSDNPIGYYPLDDLTTGNIPDYQDIIDNFPTYQDLLNYYPSYANMSGTTAYDYSGSNNHGQYSGAPDTNILPVVPGNSMATKITNSIQIDYFINKDYTGTSNAANFGVSGSSDADFSLECWIYPNISQTSVIPVLADPSNSVGIFYENGNIAFKLNSNVLSHTLVNLNKVVHVVATYSGSSMIMYIDGALVVSKSLADFTFSNTSLSLQSGPTTNSADYILINSVALYRYGIGPDRVLSHYNEALGVDPIEIAAPEGGHIFKAFDTTSPLEFRYSYPGNKSWDEFTTPDLYYNQLENSLSVLKTDSAVGKTITLDDYVTLPVAANMDSSKIEWNATSGVTVLTSIDGTVYTECENGGVIPQYSLSSFSTTRHIYIRIVLDTTDASKFIPKIKDLIIKFYNNQKVYFTNSSDYISTLEGISGVTEYDISVGEKYSSILFRDEKNGINVSADSGFNINTASSVSTIEFFYTPYSLGDSGLVSSISDGSYSAATYSWRNSGTVNKSNISAIYVNGVNKTSETDILNVFKLGNLHHVVIVFSEPISNQIKMNYSLYGAAKSLYQNISIYQSQFALLDAVKHYNMYVYKNYTIVNDDSSPSMSIAENSANYYDNDWVLFQTS